MAAVYPSSLKVFQPKTNITDTVEASHVNTLQEETAALQSSLGVNPQISSAPSPSGTFVSSSTTYSSVAARLNNIETGIVSDAHNQYVRKTSDSVNVITAGSASTKGLVVKAAVGQTANLQEWQDSTGAVVTAIGPNGALSGYPALSTYTAKGDMLVATAAGLVSRLAVGTDGQYLVADSTQATGVKWTTQTISGVVSQTNGTVTTASTSLGVVRNIFVSSSAPTGGNDGDVWIQYV